MNKLMEGVEECCRVSAPARSPLEWWENGRYFRLERKENNAGRFILVSATDAEGKKHRLIFPEGRGFLNGWTMLVEKIRGLGFKALQENKPTRIVTQELSKVEEKKWTSTSKNKIIWGGQHKLNVEEGAGSSVDKGVWMDVGDCGFGKALGSLQFCLIGKWKTKPNPYPETKVLEVWFREAWRINGEVMLAALNEDLFLLKFDSPEKAKWVLESGRRSFKGGVLQLEWWSPESGCLRRRDLGREVWIRVVGLPLHLWTPEIIRKLGDACGGFVAVDKNTETKTEMKWVRILVKMVGQPRPSVVNILEGPRSFEMQIWWEICPWVSGVYPVGARDEAETPKEEEEAEPRAGKRVESCWKKINDEGQSSQEWQTKLGNKNEHAETDAVFSVPAADQNGSGGAGAAGYGNKSAGTSAKGEEFLQQARPSGGAKGRACFLPGLKGKRVESCWKKINDKGQSSQEWQTKLGNKKEHAETDAVFSVPGADQNGSGGAGAAGYGNKSAGPSAKGEEFLQQARPSGGAKGRACLLPGLKGNVSYGPRDTAIRSPAVIESGGGLGDGLRLQLDTTRKSSHGRAAGMYKWLGPVAPGPLQAGPSNWTRVFKKNRRGNRGLIKATQPGPVGDASGSRENWRMKMGGSRSGAKGSREVLEDPAWICVRGPLLHTKESWPGQGETPSFESCWEQGLSLVAVERAALGGSGHGNGEEGFSDGCYATIVEPTSTQSEVMDPKGFGKLAEDTRFDTLASVDVSSSLFSVFGRSILVGGSSGSGDFCEHDAMGDLEPLRVVSCDGREWGKATNNDVMVIGQDPGGPGYLKGEPASGQPECTGYNNWEDSCLFKFSEYLGVTTTGFEEEILKLMRKIESQQVVDKRKGLVSETRCERELRKLECTINYSGKNQNRSGRDRGNFLLKLK